MVAKKNLKKTFKKNHMSEAEEVMPEKPRGGPFKLVVDAEKQTR